MDILWEKAIKILKEKVSQQNFETWICPIRINSLEGDQIRLAVPNRFIRDWLMENYFDLIRESIKAAAGIPLHVALMVEQETARDASGEKGTNAPVTEKAALKKGLFQDTISLTDLFPTLLYYAGFPLSKGLPGEVVKDIFSDLFLAENPIYFATE